jgi:hypothetical protein
VPPNRAYDLVSREHPASDRAYWSPGSNLSPDRVHVVSRQNHTSRQSLSGLKRAPCLLIEGIRSQGNAQSPDRTNPVSGSEWSTESANHVSRERLVYK